MGSPAKKILHIDSDCLMHKIVRYAFPGEKYAIDTVKDGKEALMALRSNNYDYDVVITEMLISYVNGYEIISDISSNSKKKIQIIITTNVSYANLNKNLGLETRDFFRKPFLVSALAQRVDCLSDYKSPSEYKIKDIVLLSAEIKSNAVQIDEPANCKRELPSVLPNNDCNVLKAETTAISDRFSGEKNTVKDLHQKISIQAFKSNPEDARKESPAHVKSINGIISPAARKTDATKSTGVVGRAKYEAHSGYALNPMDKAIATEKRRVAPIDPVAKTEYYSIKQLHETGLLQTINAGIKSTQVQQQIQEDNLPLIAENGTSLVTNENKVFSVKQLFTGGVPV
jgi:DNA-binding response OmpR family regulator